MLDDLDDNLFQLGCFDVRLLFEEGIGDVEPKTLWE